MTAVITAHNGKGRCKNSASANAASAAIVTLIESTNCSRRSRTSALSLAQSLVVRLTMTSRYGDLRGS